MGCSNTKNFPAAAEMDSNGTLTNAMNVLNSIDPSQQIEEGEKIINQAVEVIEKSAAALENVMSGKSPFEAASEEVAPSADSSKTIEPVPEDQEEEEGSELEVQDETTMAEEENATEPSDESPSAVDESPAENVEPESQSKDENNSTVEAECDVDTPEVEDPPAEEGETNVGEEQVGDSNEEAESNEVESTQETSKVEEEEKESAVEDTNK